MSQKPSDFPVIQEMSHRMTDLLNFGNKSEDDCRNCKIKDSRLAAIKMQIEAFAILAERNFSLSPSLLINSLREILDSDESEWKENPRLVGEFKVSKYPKATAKADLAGRTMVPVPGADRHEVIEPNWEHVVTSFEEMNLKPGLLRGIYSYGFKFPSAIQQRVIIPCMSGWDVLAEGGTESGRSAAVVIAILQRIEQNNPHCQALVLAQTVDAARKIQAMILSLGSYLGVTCHACRMLTNDGGQQKYKLEANRQVVVGTPEDVLALLVRRYIHTESIKMLVIDDTDILLTGKSKDQVFEVIKSLDFMECQLILMSTKNTLQMLQEVQNFIRHPVTVVVKDKQHKHTFKGVREYYVDVKTEEMKLPTLITLEKQFQLHVGQTLIFCNSINKVDWLTRKLREKNFVVDRLHADIDEKEREEIMQDFARGTLPMLVTTDLWTLDIENNKNEGKYELIINYDFPSTPRAYIERVGFARRFNSGRDGGMAISFRTIKDNSAFQDVETVVGVDIEELHLQDAKAG